MRLEVATLDFARGDLALRQRLWSLALSPDNVLVKQRLLHVSQIIEELRQLKISHNPLQKRLIHRYVAAGWLEERSDIYYAVCPLSNKEFLTLPFFRNAWTEQPEEFYLQAVVKWYWAAEKRSTDGHPIIPLYRWKSVISRMAPYNETKWELMQVIEHHFGMVHNRHEGLEIIEAKLPPEIGKRKI